MSGPRAHGVYLIFPCCPLPPATHTQSVAVLTPWTIQVVTCPPPTQSSGISAHISSAPSLPLPPAIPQLSKWPIESGKESSWEPLRLNNMSVLSAVVALLSPPQAAALAVRYASKKTGGSSKNLGGKSPGRRFGLKKMEGEGVPWLPSPSCTLPSCPWHSFEE